MRNVIAPLFNPKETRQQVSRHWYATKDGDPQGLALYERHYSCYHYADGRQRVLFVGPGEKVVLIGADADALFVWRKFEDASGQEGINCAVFRNEGPQLASVLVREAMQVAWDRWPGERLYTYVNPRALRPLPRKYRKPREAGHCFLKAGWRYVQDDQGNRLVTKHNRLLVLEALP